jgi:hypothetical protein
MLGDKMDRQVELFKIIRANNSKWRVLLEGIKTAMQVQILRMHPTE